MILVDTLIWIDHLRQRDERLSGLLDHGRVLVHAFVTGELALGNPKRARLKLDPLSKDRRNISRMMQHPDNGNSLRSRDVEQDVGRRCRPTAQTRCQFAPLPAHHGLIQQALGLGFDLVEHAIRC
ncbi:MAG: hypothetical protein MUE63_12635 [Xanthomonadales bacterium]|nr:hypothetical protein [Xanthomonadales bacterium]